MNQDERRIYLIKELLKERRQIANIASDIDEQKRLLRGLMNIRYPKEISKEFLKIQDEYLQEEIKLKGITDIFDLTPTKYHPNVYLWQGDITLLKVDSIINAANSQMLGCFIPNHNCIDNCIHTYSGIELRLECNELMTNLGHEEETGKAKLTKAYNLPSKYIIHTVGPIIYDNVTDEEINELRSCYKSIIELAIKNNIKSIAFCSISTGVFRFPIDLAAKIAIDEVSKYLDKDIKYIFNVFSDRDYDIYNNLLNKGA